MNRFCIFIIAEVYFTYTKCIWTYYTVFCYFTSSSCDGQTNRKDTNHSHVPPLRLHIRNALRILFHFEPHKILFYFTIIWRFHVNKIKQIYRIKKWIKIEWTFVLVLNTSCHSYLHHMHFVFLSMVLKREKI